MGPLCGPRLLVPRFCLGIQAATVGRVVSAPDPSSDTSNNLRPPSTNQSNRPTRTLTTARCWPSIKRHLARRTPVLYAEDDHPTLLLSILLAPYAQHEAGRGRGASLVLVSDVVGIESLHKATADI